MADGIELATAYVRIVPTTEGIQGKITSAIEPEADKAGKSSGTSLSNSFVGTAQKGFGKLGTTLGNVGKTVTTNVSAPITAAATASMAAWTQVDSGFDTVIAKTGATGSALKGMQDSVKNIATTMPVSFQDAGTAIGEVNTRFGLTGKSLEGLSTQFLKFAEINKTDVNSSIDNTQKVMSAFGLKTKDTGALLDKMNSVGQETGISMDQLESGLVSNATALKSMGLNAGDSAELIGKLSKSGVDTSVVMAGLSKVQMNSMKDGVSMQDEFKKAISSSDDAISIFGAKAGPKLYQMFNDGTLSADMFSSSLTGGNGLDGALGSVSDTFEAMEDPADQWKTVLNNLMMLGYQIGEAMMPTITQVVQTLIPIIQKLCDAWGSLSPGMQDAIVKAALVAAAAGPVISGFGKVSTGISSVLGLFTQANAGAGLLGKAFTFLSSGPIGIIVAAIAGVIAALVVLYNHNESFRNFVNQAWTDIQSVIGTVITAIQGFWTNTLQPVFQAIGDFCQAVLLPIMQTVWGAVSSLISAVFSGIKDYWDSLLKPAFQAIGDFCQNILWPVIQVVFMMIQQIVSVVFSFIQGAWQNILLPVFQAIGSFLSGTLGPVFKTIFNAIKAVVSAVFSAIKGFWDSILKPAFTAIGSFLSGTLKPVFTTVFNGIKTVVSTVFGAIKGFWDSILKPVFTAIGNAANALKSAVSGPLNAVKSTFEKVFNGIKSFLKPIINWLKGIFNFSWSLPKIKLPHFSMTGKFSLAPPSVPKLSVDWYAKAMNHPYILDQPTLFGYSGGSLLGGGEAGREIIMSEDYLKSLINEAGSGISENHHTEMMNGDINFYIQSNDPKAVAKEVRDILINEMNRKAFA